MSAEIGKSLVGRDQPAPLGLNAGPEVIILCSCQPYPHYRRCIVSARDCQVGSLPGQILIDLDARMMVARISPADRPISGGVAMPGGRLGRRPRPAAQRKPERPKNAACGQPEGPPT
jgi:hypothetical protein